MQPKEFNPQVFLEFLCYTIFTGIILYLTASGKYLQYVTPRMVGYLYFSAVVLLIWAVSGLRRLFRPQYRVRFLHCFVLVIPILLLLFPQRQLSASEIASRYSGSNFSGNIPQANLDPLPPQESLMAATAAPTLSAARSDFSTHSPTTENPTQTPRVMSVGTPLLRDSALNAEMGETAMISGVAVNFGSLPGLDVENRKITIDNDFFYAWVMEIYLHKFEYEGFQISITGFVFKNPKTMEMDEFVLARLVMACCAADLMPSGLLCKYDDAANLEMDSWVTVEGTIALYKFRTFDDVRIRVTNVLPAEEVAGYIYPY